MGTGSAGNMNSGAGDTNMAASTRAARADRN
jgi:hypothetical protein